MILADKIINERKKNGWSQEELADQLGVSRQSVSKWEGAQAVPDIQKIIKMAELFGVSTDYLLRDELGETEKEEYRTLSETFESAADVRKVSLEEANKFLSIIKEITPQIANAVSICILSPVLLIFLSALSSRHIWGVTEPLAAGLGLVVLLLMVSAAVFVFITTGTKKKPFEYIEKEPIETEYGVSGMVKERKEAYQGTYTAMLSGGIICCILSALPIIVSSIATQNEVVVVSMVCVCLIIVSFGVNIIIRSSSIWGSYDQLLQENDFTVTSKKASEKIESIGGVYWTIMTAIYLLISFLTRRWDITWLIWPVAGVLYEAVSVIIKMVVSSK